MRCEASHGQDSIAALELSHPWRKKRLLKGEWLEYLVAAVGASLWLDRCWVLCLRQKTEGRGAAHLRSRAHYFSVLCRELDSACRNRGGAGRSSLFCQILISASCDFAGFGNRDCRPVFKFAVSRNWPADRFCAARLGSGHPIVANARQIASSDRARLPHDALPPRRDSVARFHCRRVLRRSWRRRA